MSHPAIPPSIPKKHPIALAFQNPAAHSTYPHTWLSSRLKSCAWRQKYSQSTIYPCEISVILDPSSLSQSQSHSPSTTNTNTNTTSLTLQIKQEQRGEQNGVGTGAIVWNAAHVLSAFLCKQAGCSSTSSGNGSGSGNTSKYKSLLGKRVCDLGCGTGLTGLVAVALGSREVMFTDIGPVLELTRENVVKGLAGIDRVRRTKAFDGGDDGKDSDCQSQGEIINRPYTTKVEEYWWGSETLGLKGYDVILISDCILPKLYPIEPLVVAIDELLIEDSGVEEGGGVCYLSYEHRTWLFDPRVEFRRLCKERRLKVEVVEVEDLDEYFVVEEDIEVWVVTREKC